MLIAELLRLSSPKSRLLMAATVPVGVMYGLAEIGFGYALQHYLTQYGLLNGTLKPLAFEVSSTVAVLGMTLVVNILRFLSQVIPAYCTEAMAYALRAHFSRLIIGDHDGDTAISVAEAGHLSGNLIGRSAAYAMSISQAVQGLVLLLTLLAGMLSLSATLAGIICIAAGLLMLPAMLARRLPNRYSTSYYGALSAFNARILRVVRNLPFIRLSGVGGLEATRLTQDARSINSSHDRYSTFVFALSTWPYVVGILTVVALVEINARQNLIPIAFIVPFVYLLVRLAAALSIFQSTVARLRHEAVFAKELVSLEQRLRTDAVLAGTETIEGTRRLEAQQLVFGRGSELGAPVDLDLRMGNTLLISGPSGVGKSTLLLTLVGLLPPLGGKVLWNGIETTRLAPHALRSRIGYAGADPFLLDDTIRANLLYGAHRQDVDDAAMWQILDLSRCGFVREFSGGLDHILREGGDGISAGQKQRLSIARALLRQPEVLILDEATANIDEATEALIMREIRHQWPEMIIIAVSHRSSLAEFANCKLDLGVS